MACLHGLAGSDLVGSAVPLGKSTGGSGCLCQASWSWPLCWRLHTRFGGWDYVLEGPMGLAEVKGREALWEAAGLGSMMGLLCLTVAWPACEAFSAVAVSAASSCGWLVRGGGLRSVWPCIYLVLAFMKQRGAVPGVLGLVLVVYHRPPWRKRDPLGGCWLWGVAI